MPVWPPFVETEAMFHTIGAFAVHMVSALFFIGLAGSTVVVLFSFFDDFTQLFAKEKFESIQPPPPAK
jgi:hypothetical protein